MDELPRMRKETPSMDEGEAMRRLFEIYGRSGTGLDARRSANAGTWLALLIVSGSAGCGIAALLYAASLAFRSWQIDAHSAGLGVFSGVAAFLLILRILRG